MTLKELCEEREQLRINHFTFIEINTTIDFSFVAKIRKKE